jgi:NodT family efflux transporter outer membrane factor (OMF) lipoprotein
MVSLIHRLSLSGAIALALTMPPQAALAGDATLVVPPTAAAEPPAPVPDFWSGFHAPELSALIAQGFAANPDVASATARLAAARARLGAARARMRPSAGLVVNGQKNITVLGDILQSGLQPNVELDVGYDVDLFGANKSNKRAEKARLAASGLDLAAVRLSLSAEIARAYVNISALDAEMGILSSQLGLVQRLSGLVDARTREGEAGAFEAGLVVQQLVGVKTQQQVLIQSRTDMVAGLAVLLGQEPGQFTFTPEPFEKIAVPELDDTQPTDLLARRPDVLAARERMSAAKFDAQTVDRQRLPSLRLSASGIVGLITGGGGFGILSSVGGTMAAALFQGGAITARRQESSAVARDALAAYRKTQLGSLREAVSSMAARSSANEREALWQQSIDAVGRSARVAQSAYLEGEVAINLVVDARGNEIASRRALIQARRDRLGATIDVFRAMGGPPEPAPGGASGPAAATPRVSLSATPTTPAYP